MRIKGFYHIYLINDWYAIVMNQMRILLTSGLYDACDEIAVGIIYTPAEKASLERLIIKIYPKLKIKYASTNPKEYEFPTLHFIEMDSTDYAGFYFHTKGISRPFETNIINWRCWLEEAILNRWREHYMRIALQRYDVSSVNEMRSPDHFSGNFWWFNRRYIKRLPKIKNIDRNNRFLAEQWICMCPDRKAYAKEFVEPGRDVFKIQYKIR